jgi:hypothetical protein
MRKMLISLAFVSLILALLKIGSLLSPRPSSVVSPPSLNAPPLGKSSQELPNPSITTDSDSRKAGSPLAAELNSPNYDARHDVATLHTMLRQYLRITHRRPGPPIGNDSDLARAFTGHNPMKLVVLPTPHPALSPDGRLVDRWGTSYFIHPRGNLAFEIRSAGPDRKLFTNDDLIENPGTGRTDHVDLPPE